ncbi:hypothetical protein [Mucilaginibacter ginsenosidivorans]|uniref:Uncharacterized protein n=1 Tax=Mucilaginibacter ginsenosidivorans TaxID=398053 RepID=A0A5B8UQC2_9SPHI|nr:hypothetical protein [Mucilaginibacter ginsenosidivorans]QEC61028.1 hypothetical protein FRZ54_00020 [Mucilaginibacter ginsenosidivorans]
MKRYTIKTNYLKTIDWLNGKIVDWVSAGQQYSLDGEKKQLAQYHYAFNFDGSITSPDGQYAFVFKRLGTKGLLLKMVSYFGKLTAPIIVQKAMSIPRRFLFLIM